MIKIMLKWQCPSGCAEARQLAGDLARDHLKPAFEIFTQPKGFDKAYFLADTKTLDEVLDNLHQFCVKFTKARPNGFVNWKESGSGHSRQYHRGEYVGYEADRVHPSKSGEQEAPQQEQNATESSQPDAGAVDSAPSRDDEAV